MKTLRNTEQTYAFWHSHWGYEPDWSYKLDQVWDKILPDSIRIQRRRIMEDFTDIPESLKQYMSNNP